MRIAHIIIAHKNPIQLERLLNVMSHPDFDFYIHIDKKIDIRPFEYLKEISGVNFISKRNICNWGGYSTLRAMVISLKEVLENKIDYGFYNLLSAQDYPIKTNNEIVEFFSKNKNHSYVYYDPKDESDWWVGGVERFQKYHLTDYNFKGKSTVERIINSVLPRRKFPLSLQLYGGSKASWWSLNKEAAVYLINYLQPGNKLNTFLKFCWGTDEFVIPTVLLNSPLKEWIINDNLRYIDFPEGMANPKILGVEDKDKLMQSTMLFARKFDMEISPEILDEIDEHLKEKSL
jgi:hypothetical protein